MTRNQPAGCLVSVFFGHDAALLKTCEFDIIHLPIMPTATYLTNSKFLISSATTQYWINEITDKSIKSSRLNGCRSCIIQPPYNGRTEKSNGGLVLRPSTDNCQKETGLVMTVGLNPLLGEAFTLPTRENHELNSSSTTMDYQGNVIEHVKIELQAKAPLEIDTTTLKNLVRDFHRSNQERQRQNTAGGIANNVVGFLVLF